MGNKIKGKDLIEIGFPQTNAVNIALGQISRYKRKYKKQKLLNELKNVLDNKAEFEKGCGLGKVLEALSDKPVEVKMQSLKTQRAPYEIFGENEIEDVASINCMVL